MKSFLTYTIEQVKKPTGELKDACWKGYTAVGTKKKNGRTVSNCVPANESTDVCPVCGQTPCNCTHINESQNSDIGTSIKKQITIFWNCSNW